MINYISILCMIMICITLFTGCANQGYEKYSYEFFGTFDTVVQIMGYAKSSREFNNYADIAYKRFSELNELFDVYNDYDGINNIKTINDNAGIKPVKVNQEILLRKS